MARAGEGTSAADEGTAAGAADAAFGDSSSSESEDEGPQQASAAAAAAAAADEREAAKAWILQQYAADGSDSGSEGGTDKAASEVSILWCCSACLQECVSFIGACKKVSTFVACDTAAVALAMLHDCFCVMRLASPLFHLS
jgi:hypothetical protein